MNTRAFGSGRPVSLFTLGTMRALNSAAQMAEVLDAAAAAGINHLETAPAYGPAERFLGEALRQNSRTGSNHWVITSKLLPGLSFEEGQRRLDQILERLGCPQLDNLAIHGINREEHLDWALVGDGSRLLDWAVSSGRVSQVGFSSHGSNPLIDRALRSQRFRFCSLHLHWLDPQRLPLARWALAHGLGVMAISPADKGGRLQAPSPTLVEDCTPFAPLELAYRFLLAQGISTLTVGASAAGDLQLAATLAQGDEPLSQAEQQALVTAERRQQERLGQEHCKQCQACLPCPNEVPIPELLRLRNLAMGHGLTEFTQERYNLIGRAGHWWEEHDASACERCGACLPRCPHHLPIPDLLADTHQRLKASPRRRLWS
ncbi:aldo/keto reductase [Synechococcus sp. RS9907]|uniref:aldo/keto reductase n=1 Tax=Synechococcus sp. RS9907 TaxID=221350 RepID=UPI00165E7C2B|nr:aldo/keto reductase [Synechococcus sp. RS9907]